jgi:hypothetical protein
MKTEPCFRWWTVCAAGLFLLLAPCRAQVTDWFTEGFDGNTHFNDLQYRTITFTPNGTTNFYYACQQPTNSFPVDPAGGTVVSLPDDGFVQITLTGDPVAIYNTRTNVLFIGSNGYITMNAGDSNYIAYVVGGGDIQHPTGHFNLPRVSGWFDDLDPSTNTGSGTVSWKETGQSVVVTFQNVKSWYSGYTNNSFQMELFEDGRIRITYLQIDDTSGVSGLSSGQGLPAGFAISDMDLYNNCSLPTIITQPASITVPVGGSAAFSVTAFSSLPLNYYWYRNNVFIPGATNASYATNNVQLVDSGNLFSCLVSNSFGSVLSSNAVLTVTNKPVAGTLTMLGFYLYLPIQSNGCFVVNNIGGRYNPAGTGGITGTDFWSPPINGVPVYNFAVGVNGASYVNGYYSTPTYTFKNSIVYNYSTTNLQHSIISGTIVNGLDFTRDVSYAYNSKVITIIDTLTNTSAAALNNVATLDNTDPDQDTPFGPQNTYNYILSVNHPNDLVIATGPVTGLSIGFGSDSGIQVPSVAGFANITPYPYLTVQNAGANADVGMNLAQNYGTIGVGQSKTATWYMIFDDSEQKVINDFSNVYAANFPLITLQPTNVSVAVGSNATFTVGAGGTMPLSYFWRSNSVPIPGASLTNFTVINAQLAASGALFSCLVSNIYGTALSSNALLTVTNVAVVIPPLGIATLNNWPVVVWPASATNYVLQMTTNLLSGNWVTITNGIPFGGVQLTNVPGTTIYRLQ